MDFFNKLGKKASETYQYTKDKTSKISEELKLKGKVSDLKSKIEEAYLEVGKIVYEEFKNGTDVSREAVSGKCDEIKSMQEEIEKLNDQILKVKNIKKCANCGEEIELNVKFCPKCGKEQPEEVKNVEVKEEVTETAEDADVVDVKDVDKE